jgi:serine/threonine protein kinase
MRLGVYEVTALLGAGGMGEVYRARDPRLDRQVAIKLLPDTTAADTALFTTRSAVVTGDSCRDITSRFRRRQAADTWGVGVGSCQANNIADATEATRRLSWGGSARRAATRAISWLHAVTHHMLAFRKHLIVPPELRSGNSTE